MPLEAGELLGQQVAHLVVEHARRRRPWCRCPVPGPLSRDAAVSWAFCSWSRQPPAAVVSRVRSWVLRAAGGDGGPVGRGGRRGDVAGRGQHAGGDDGEGDDGPGELALHGGDATRLRPPEHPGRSPVRGGQSAGHQLGEQGHQPRGVPGASGRHGHRHQQPVVVGLVGGARGQAAEPHLRRGRQGDRRQLDRGPAAGRRRPMPAAAGHGHRHVGDPEPQALDPQPGHVEQGGGRRRAGVRTGPPTRCARPRSARRCGPPVSRR